MPLIIGGDDLYAHEPFIAQLRAHRLHHVLVCKPGSPPTLYTWVDDLVRLGACEQGQWLALQIDLHKAGRGRTGNITAFLRHYPGSSLRPRLCPRTPRGLRLASSADSVSAFLHLSSPIASMWS